MKPLLLRPHEHADYHGGRVGCPECGDEYWGRAPGDECSCGELLIEFSENDTEAD